MLIRNRSLAINESVFLNSSPALRVGLIFALINNWNCNNRIYREINRQRNKHSIVQINRMKNNYFSCAHVCALDNKHSYMSMLMHANRYDEILTIYICRLLAFGGRRQCLTQNWLCISHCFHFVSILQLFIFCLSLTSNWLIDYHDHFEEKNKQNHDNEKIEFIIRSINENIFRPSPSQQKFSVWFSFAFANATHTQDDFEEKNKKQKKDFIWVIL